MFIHLIWRLLPPCVDQVDDLDLLVSHDPNRKTHHLCKRHTSHYNLQSGHLPAGRLQRPPQGVTQENPPHTSTNITRTRSAHCITPSCSCSTGFQSHGTHCKTWLETPTRLFTTTCVNSSRLLTHLKWVSHVYDIKILNVYYLYNRQTPTSIQLCTKEKETSQDKNKNVI